MILNPLPKARLEGPKTILMKLASYKAFQLWLTQRLKAQPEVA